MFKRIATALWGNFESTDELKKFGFLASIFGIIIGTYWTLRPLKDGIFNAIVGLENWQPTAKILSMFVVFPLVIMYSKLIDTFPRHKVFYALVSIYAVLALVFAFFLMNPEFGLENTIKSPTRMLGWAWYIYVESFGSLIVALFWAFTTDTTLPDSARRGFPIIALFGQIGNMVGPFFLNAKRLGLATSAPIVAICGGLMILMAALFWLMVHTIPAAQFAGYESEKEEAKEDAAEPGFMEGLKLILTQPYLLGIFVIVTVYEIVITILDFHFKSTAAAVYSDEASLSSYMSQYAYLTGFVSMICVLLGINNIQRRLGMRASLVLLPLLVTGAVLLVKINPTWLAAAFWIMVLAKAINYALNQPTLKQLYIPTTKETKYKSQAWIEMFGSRLSKGAGSAINTFRGSLSTQYGALEGVAYFLSISTMVSGGLITVWLFAALYIAKTYNKAIKENKVVC